MKIKYLILCFLATTLCLSQELPTILPSTPDIASFQKYGNIPVGVYTGIPNINIPLYTIETKSGVVVPISLSYHAGGIKVDEKASRVGLGWILNTGGVVSSQIIGLPDYGEIIPNSNTFDPTYSNNGVEDDDDYLYAMGVVDFPGYNGADSGYDIHSYRFLGRSGKFFIDNNGTPNLIPYEKLKIERTNLNGPIDITDELGNLYKFQTASISELNMGCPPNNPGYWALAQNNVDFLLSSIETNKKETINFDYTTYQYDYIVSKSETDYLVSNTFQNYGCDVRTKETCTDEIVHQEPILTKIRFNNNKNEVRFFYSDDLNYPINGTNTRKDFLGNPALRKIEIWNNYQKVEEYELIYDYFIVDGAGANPTEDQQRLKLTEVIHNGLESHTFQYEESINLPERFSYSQDSWGNYNGKMNSGLVPSFSYGNETFSGADRTVSATHPKANILKKVIYPTGGYTEYFYENNTYYDSDGGETFENGDISFPSATQNLQSHPFTIAADYSNIQLHFTNACDEQGDPNNPPGVGNECEIEILDSNNQQVWYQTQNGIYDASFLSSGSYTLRYTYFGAGCNCDVAITYLETVTTPAVNVLSGGLRLNKVNNFDGENNIETFYEYNKPNSSESSGIVQGDPDFYSILETVKPDNSICEYLVRKSSSIFPIAVTGSSVGYSNVTVYTRSQQENGRIEYKYTNSGTGFPTGFFNSLITLEPDRTWEKGLLEEKVIFNSQGDTVRLEKNNYEFDNLFVSQSSDYYDGNKLAAGYSINLLKPETWMGMARNPATFNWNYYYLRSSWVKKSWSLYRDFFGATTVEEKVIYTYDNLSAQIQTIEKILSKGNREVTTFYFPDNILTEQSLGEPHLTNPQKTTIDLLKTEHQHQTGEVIQTVKELFDPTDVLLSKSQERKTFSSWTNNGITLILPDTLKTLKGIYNEISNPLQSRLIFEEYGVDGNLREVRKSNGLPIAYIWGYDDRYPIAKIENATFAMNQAETITESQQTLIDNAVLATFDETNNSTENILRTALQNLQLGFPEALVTTFTYDPLIGVTSMTDPRGNTVYYEYDGNNRLETVRNEDLKLLGDYEYHYKGH